MLPIQGQVLPTIQIQKRGQQVAKIGRSLLFNPGRKRPRRKCRNEARRRGALYGEKVWRALKTSIQPSWVRRVRRPKYSRNSSEVREIIVFTRFGEPITLRIISSFGAYTRFLNEKHGLDPWLGFIVVRKRDSLQTIAENAWRILANVYDQVQSLMLADTSLQKFARA